MKPHSKRPRTHPYPLDPSTPFLPRLPQEKIPHPPAKTKLLDANQRTKEKKQGNQKNPNHPPRTARLSLIFSPRARSTRRFPCAAHRAIELLGARACGSRVSAINKDEAGAIKCGARARPAGAAEARCMQARLYSSAVLARALLRPLTASWLIKAAGARARVRVWRDEFAR